METLPDELLEKVFEFLLARDRKAGVLVNKRWREVGEAPKFWTWMKLPRVECRPTNQARVIEMIKSRRLAKVKEVNVDLDAVSDDLLQAIGLHQGLKEISLFGYKERRLPAELDTQLLIQVVTGMESLAFIQQRREGGLTSSLCLVSNHGYDFFPLPSEPVAALLTKMSQGCSLKELHFTANIREVPASLLVSAIKGLVKLDLGCYSLTSNQVEALLEAIDQEETSLKKLSLTKSLPSRRTEHFNLKPLVKLEEVRLIDNWHTREDLIDFFAALSPSTKLRKLVLTTANYPWELSDSSTSMIAKALNFLEEVSMNAYCWQVCVHSNLHLFGDSVIVFQ